MARKVGDIEILHTKSTPIDTPRGQYNGFKPSTTTLPKGWKKNENCRAFQVDTIWERDIKIPMRDGVILYADVFRPADESQKVPAIIPWSPYGKSGTGFFQLDLIPDRVGIPQSMLSGFEKFEAPDPAEWTQHGYAVVNIDARGTFMSEGDIRCYGTAEGQDGYDAVEYVATLPWCNGKVATMGNSWLGTAQWFIAAERPPHLACILPLEGQSDLYRETICRGGIPAYGFWSFVLDNLYGKNETENAGEMLRKYTLMNEYWADKRAKIEKINVPAYVLASMSTALHTVGTLRGFEEIPHNKKWLRIHPTQEWHDLYQPENIADFKKFLDFHTKQIQNDWESTPKARISVIRYNDSPLMNLPFSDYPVPETKYKTLYLSKDGDLQTQPGDPDQVSYQSDVPAQQIDADSEEVSFTYTFPERCTLIGPSKAILYMACPEHDDMDVFVIIRKANENGKVLRNLNIPLKDLGKESEDNVDNLNTLKYIGPNGCLRASHRAIDPKFSKPHWPAHDHTKEIKVSPGDIVKLEIGIWPGAIQFEEGEKIVFRVSGHDMRLAEFVPLRGAFSSGNKGKHILHFGGGYNSRVEIPTVPL